jgi:hypothetical protein
VLSICVSVGAPERGDHVDFFTLASDHWREMPLLFSACVSINPFPTLPRRCSDESWRVIELLPFVKDMVRRKIRERAGDGDSDDSSGMMPITSPARHMTGRLRSLPRGAHVARGAALRRERFVELVIVVVRERCRGRFD